MGKRTVFSVVIPVYYNQASLEVLYRALKKVEKKLVVRMEVVFVDDGSGDASWEIIQKLQRKDRAVKGLKLVRNFGSVNAILAGFKYVTGDCVGVIAADLQDPPELFVELYRHWKLGKKTVMAVRKQRHDSWMSRFLAGGFYAVLRRYALPTMPRGGFDFVLLDRQVVEVINAIDEKNSSVMALIAWLGFEREEVYYTRKKRQHGVSQWTLEKKLKLFVDSFAAFSYMPIRFISVTGFCLAVLSFVFGGYILFQKVVSGIAIAGWASLMVVVLFLSAFQLIALGVLGEYLWRTLDATRKRPNYIVDRYLE